MSFLSTEDILRVLHAFNPWWTGRARSKHVPPFRRLAFDASCLHLLDPRTRRGVLLAGPRRVGKTTVLDQLADMLVEKFGRPRNVVYLSLDHPILKMLDISKILSLYEEQIQKESGEVYLLLDEVQYSKDWDLHLKFLIDHRDDLRIVATGSAALKQKHEAIDSGVGRWLTVPMPTLSFYEFLHLRGRQLPDVPPDVSPQDLLAYSPPQLADLAQRFRPVLPEFQRYLLVGGFPETALHNDTDYCQRIIREDVVERVLKRDVVALFGIRKVNDLERLFIYLCFHTGGILSVKTCAVEIGTTTATVAGYLVALQSANLIYRVSPVETGGKKVLREQNKYYLVDAALRNAVLLRGEEVLTSPEELGVIVETAVLRHLYSYYYLDQPRVSYWRDPGTDREVDVIVQSPSYTIPVEVKYRSSASLDSASGLARFCAKERSVRHAYLVSKEDRDLAVTRLPGVSTQFAKIPAHIFTYLLGQAEHALWEQSGRRIRTPRPSPI